MQLTKSETREYQRYLRGKLPKKPVLRSAVLAFIVGGAITTVGQVIMNWLISTGMTPKEAAPPTSAAMIFIGALLTGLGVYDELGRYGGMGAALPITGFANSIVAPAMEFKREGFILGVGAKMFTIAGPVLVYGLLTAMAIGLITWLLGSYG